jgi:hypothetical protein
MPLGSEFVVEDSDMASSKQAGSIVLAAALLCVGCVAEPRGVTGVPGGTGVPGVPGETDKTDKPLATEPCEVKSVVSDCLYRIGLREVNGAGAAGPFTVPPALLVNASHGPGACFAELRLVNFGGTAVVTLPTPASDADAYLLGVENRSGHELLFRNDGSVGSPQDTVRLYPFITSDQDPDNWRNSERPGSVTYRQTLSSRPDGVQSYPGFSFAGD